MKSASVVTRVWVSTSLCQKSVWFPSFKLIISKRRQHLQTLTILRRSLKSTMEESTKILLSSPSCLKKRKNLSLRESSCQILNFLMEESALCTKWVLMMSLSMNRVSIFKVFSHFSLMEHLSLNLVLSGNISSFMRIIPIICWDSRQFTKHIKLQWNLERKFLKS